MCNNEGSNTLNIEVVEAALNEININLNGTDQPISFDRMRTEITVLAQVAETWLGKE